MRLRRKLYRQSFSILAAILIVVQSIAPVFPVVTRDSFAQEVTNTATETTPEPTPTTAPEPTPTVEPTSEITPTPEPTDSASSPQAVTPTPEPTPAADITISPTPVPTPTPAPEQTPSADITISPTPVPTPTPTEAPKKTQRTGHENISFDILENVSARSVHLQDVYSDTSATLATDKLDYAPTDSAVITGSGLLPNTEYTLFVSSTDPPPSSFSVTVTTTDQGTFVYSYQLDGTYRPNYSVTLKDSSGTVVATTTFTDAAPVDAGNPSASLDQCANDPAPSPHTDGCSASATDWVNGNLGASKSSYFEGDSIPYRLTFDNLSTSSNHNVVIEWDTTKSGKHAIDYLTTFNRTVATANPCLGVSGCSSSMTFPIPADTQVTGAPVTPVAGNFTLYGGTITSVSEYTYADGTGFSGDKSARITITFTASQANPVLSWGGHIATRDDWGPTMAATAISGSPYHTRLIDLDGSGGNQDRSLSADAVIFPGSIIIIKQANPEGSTPFGFTASPSPLSNFSLVDDGTTSNTYVFSNITNFQTYSVAETAPPAWTLNSIICGVTSPNGGSQTVNSPGVSINLKEGENVTCTYTNTAQTGTIELKKVWSGTGGQTTLNIGTSAGGSQVDTQLTGAAGATPLTTEANTVNTGTYYVSETGGLNDYTSSLACTDNGNSVTPGNGNSLNVANSHAVVCTFTNTRTQGKIELQKDFIGSPENVTIKIGTSQNGAEVDSDLLTADGTDGEHSVNTGTFYVSEVLATPTNYTSALACYNDINHNNTVDTGDTSHTVNTATGELLISISEDVICIFTNTRNTGTIELKKHWAGTAGSITLNIGTTINGNEIDTQAISGSDGTTGQNPVNTGAYYLSETGGLTDYTSVLVCYNDADNNGINDSEDSVSVDTNDKVSIATGQHVICTYTNTRNTGTVFVKKVMVGGTDTFAYTGTPNGSISINNETIQATVDTGAYTSTEVTKAGWDLTSVVCNDSNSTGDVGTRTANFNVESGETVTCTFTNTKRAHIIIKKDAVPDSNTQAFTFNNNFGNGSPSTFNLTDTTTAGLPSYDAEVLPGKYAVSENSVPTGWKLDGTSCDQAETVSDIDVASGETVTCTFTNVKLAKITLVKNTIGGNGTFDFVMTGTSLPLSAQLTTSGGTDSEIFNNIDPDNTYSITETPIPAGWAKTSATCDNQDPVTAITPNAGEEIICTFTNNKPAAQIDLTPLTATNKIGDNHVISANIQIHNGNGSWGPASNGTLVTFSLANTNGATASFVGGFNTCTTISGSCSVTINSPTSGNVSISAISAPTILGVTVNVATGTGGDNSVDAQKDYVNARISISPLADTNEVNDDHNFIVKVEQSIANDVWTNVENAAVNAIVTPSTSLDVSDCNAGTDTNGECTVTINSSIAGVFTIIARSTITVGGVTFKLQTNGVGQNSGSAVKTYVDASIALTPQTATNNINDPHTITAHVTKNNGSGSTDAAGVTVTFAMTSGTATFVGGDNDCITNASGVCTTQIVDSSPGANIIDATTTFSVGGISLTRATTNENYGPEGTDSAEKTYAAGRIIIEKQTLPDDSTQSFEFNPSWSESNFNLTDDQQEDSGWLAPGIYSITEIISTTGWDLTDINCLYDDEATGSAILNGKQIELGANDTVTCIFTNTQRGKIIVTKYNDKDGDGKLQEGEGVLEGWTINVGEDSEITDSTGTVEFPNLTPGSYSVGEDLKTGWEQTNLFCDSQNTRDELFINQSDNGYFASVGAGETVHCSILNHSLTPEITIAKTNNKLGIDQAPGNSVVYTLTITVDESDANDVTVKDLLPDGFKYRTGSWTASSNTRGDLKTLSVTTEPTYASPGTWTLGDMVSGEIVTLTLIADIDGGQHPGLYKDVAWAKGTSLASNTEYALGVSSPFVDNKFVGTNVNVVKEQQSGVSIAIVKQGEVLGASTVALPATGANNIWIILGSVMLSLGLSLTTIGYIMRKRYV